MPSTPQAEVSRESYLCSESVFQFDLENGMCSEILTSSEIIKGYTRGMIISYKISLIDGSSLNVKECIL